MAGICTPGFIRWGASDPGREVVGGVGQGACGDRAAAGDVRQIRPYRRGSIRALQPNGRAHSSSEVNTVRPRRSVSRRRLTPRLQLLLSPFLEVIGRVRVQHESHLGVLQAAELRALPGVQARLVGDEHFGVRASGNRGPSCR